MDLLGSLEEAIVNRKVIKFDYKGEGERVGNPHAVYSHEGTGNVNVDIYLTGGYSSDMEKIPGWRQFSLSKIDSIMLLDEVFEIAEGFNSDSKQYKKAIKKVK